MEINEGQTTAHMLAREGCHTCREICHQRYRKENQDKQASKQTNWHLSASLEREDQGDQES